MATLTGNNRRREQRLQSLLLDRLVLRYERRIANEIRRAMNEAANLVSSGASPNYMLSNHKNRIDTIMLSMYRDTAERFASYFSNTEKARAMLDETKQSVPTTPVVDFIIGEWVRANVGELITEISMTTMSNIRDIVENGVSEGLSEKDIAKQIKAVAPNKSASRAQTIARTETHRAANATGLETAKQVGVEMMKVWVPSGGGRTRDSHRRAGDDYSDGIPIDDVFIVGGERLRYPGDPSGSAEETINCRCALLYEMV